MLLKNWKEREKIKKKFVKILKNSKNFENIYPY